MATETRPELSPKRVVIVGGGFGGLSAAQALARAPVAVTLIDRHNYHLFQPLLYQVATAGLSPADIASPIRSILGRQKNARVMLAKVTGVDLAAREVETDAGSVPFDTLIIATGARHAYFGHSEWEEHARGLKKIEDATALRRRILLAFEKAETETDEAERGRLLTFVVVGGGPTGVEMAGAVAELATKALASDFRAIDPRMTKVLLLEAGPRLLPSFSPASSEAAAESLRKLGVEVRTGTPVTDVTADGVEMGAERIASRTMIWAAGVRASAAGKWLSAETDPVGRVKVGPDLSLPGHPEVFVIGDTAHVPGPDGRPLPGVAPVAKQQGRYVAKALGVPPPVRLPFRYRDYGSMATIGRKHAVAEIGKVRLTGFIAWVAWCVAHIWFLIGFRNRFVVALNWVWNYLTFQRGTRLIVGSDEPLEAAEPPRSAMDPPQPQRQLR